MFSEEELKKIIEERKNWEDKILARYRESGSDKNPKTPSGITIKDVYEPEDLKELTYIEDIGFPGRYPFTRGVYPTMYRGRAWTMRQYSGFADAEQTNERFKYMISQGQTGLSVAFDLPTQMGYDSDSKISHGEVGRVGVTINSLKDFEILFSGIELDKVSTSFTINAPATIILAMYIAVAEKMGVSKDKLRGTVQNDILKEYIARGAYIFPLKPALRLIVDIIDYCSQNMPLFNTISIAGYHMREAGANAIQEVAFTIANGIQYIEEVLKKDILIDDFAPRLSFFFCMQNNFLEEIAKLRAARRIWAKILKNRFNAKKPQSLSLRFHTQTAGASLLAQQPKVNIIRVTLQALASVLGGTQSLHTCGFDEALALPTEDSVLLSLRTQQVIANETGVTDFVDPFGGSYVIESLTSQIESQVNEYLEIIEEMGGMPNAIENGYVQDEILRNAYRIQKRIENGQDKVVGLNIFKMDEKAGYNIFELDEAVEKKLIERLKDMKKSRDEGSIKQKLQELKEKAISGENIMPILIETVKTYATIQEICDVFREVFGEYDAPNIM